MCTLMSSQTTFHQNTQHLISLHTALRRTCMLSPAQAACSSPLLYMSTYQRIGVSEGHGHWHTSFALSVAFTVKSCPPFQTHAMLINSWCWHAGGYEDSCEMFTPAVADRCSGPVQV